MKHLRKTLMKDVCTNSRKIDPSLSVWRHHIENLNFLAIFRKFTSKKLSPLDLSALNNPPLLTAGVFYERPLKLNSSYPPVAIFKFVSHFLGCAV